MTNNSYKTAIKRKTLSSPLNYLIKEGKVTKNHWILDYGCGRGDDMRWLKSNKYDVRGWDPTWYKNDSYRNRSYDVVLCTYVLNVVNATTRKNIIKRLKDLTNRHGKVYITVRRDIKKHTVSKRGTHQYSVKLPFKVVKESSAYCIYEI
jgi:DNA phosphorothioation-associated putative methyltransferase